MWPLHAGFSHPSPAQPSTHTHFEDVESHAPWPEHKSPPAPGHAISPQSLPAHPAAHMHVPLTHAPRGFDGVSSDAAGVTAAERGSEPRWRATPEHESGHVRVEQSKRLQPSWHSHVPEAVHRPWPEHELGHSRLLQSPP